MKFRKLVIAIIAFIVGLPVLLVIIAIVSVSILDQNNGTIVSSGLEREYLLYVPTSYEDSTPTALVISMHGAAMWPAHQKNISLWNQLADEHDFIVVYPSAIKLPRVWHLHDLDRLVKDVDFISDLIDSLEANYNIDPARIYANGLSNGGGMAFVLSCTLPGRIAAIGVVATAQPLPSSWCDDPQPMPIIAFHGTFDRFAPYAGGRSPIAPPEEIFPNIPNWAENWARRNQCLASAIDSVVADDVTLTHYSNCPEDADVVLYTIIRGGHTWPGGKPLPKWLAGSTSNSVSATNLTWRFFVDHPLLSD